MEMGRWQAYQSFGKQSNLSAYTTVIGTVARVSRNGFELAEHPGWFNVSRYADPQPPMPTVGDVVSVTLDDRGYVRRVRAKAEECTDCGKPAERKEGDDFALCEACGANWRMEEPE